MSMRKSAESLFDRIDEKYFALKEKGIMASRRILSNAIESLC